MKTIRVIISGGGTGGHIFPAIAIAKAILQKQPDAEILFVGAEGKMEMEKIPAAGFKIIGLPIAGIQRRLTWKNLLVPFKVMKSLIKARKIIRDFKPDVAIGVGGYASGPLLRAATSMGIKTLIQEQNSFPGITNRILSKKADRICVAYPGLEKYFPKSKIVFTGNPVRLEVLDTHTKRQQALEFFRLDASKKTLLVIGGSLGAHTINLAIRNCAVELVSQNIQIIWQTGKHFYQTAWSHSDGMESGDVRVYDFIREMDLAYAAADLIVSRAGAMSIAELCIIAKSCILIPSPNVAEDHQTKNAMALVTAHAAWLLRDDRAEKELGSVILKLNSDPNLQRKMSQNLFDLRKPDADKKIADEVFALGNKS